MNETTVLIDLTIDAYITTISVPELNVSIVSHAAKYFATDLDKTVHMLRLLAQILEGKKK
ncbi:hypothetical protein [Brasilonema sp. UFV-L1]|uniref:hypothetical protein n=1 Tax=Brasilonema sp. UFV-L1 TaxID=2234130 RepID=UPI00145CE3F0|nr:hypothetical protein [Brasilonema sp. UFV-L1]